MMNFCLSLEHIPYTTFLTPVFRYCLYRCVVWWNTGFRGESLTNAVRKATTTLSTRTQDITAVYKQTKIKTVYYAWFVAIDCALQVPETFRELDAIYKLSKDVFSCYICNHCLTLPLIKVL